MLGKVGKKTFTVADLYAEASKLVKGEMQQLKNAPLTTQEEEKMQAFAKLISKSVLKDMKLV